MLISNRIEHYFFGCGLCLRIGSALGWGWFDRPILGYHVAAPRDCCVQTTKRADVNQTLHSVPKHAINYILRTAHSAAFMVMCVPLHGGTRVVNNLDARNGSVNGGGISQVSQEDLDVAIVAELRLGRPSNEGANTIPFLQ